MAITTMNGLVTALSRSPGPPQIYLPSATNVAGGWINLNQAVTSSFGILAAPTAFGSGGTTYNQASFTAGFPKWRAGSGTTAYIGKITSNWQTVGTIHVYDVAWACSGLSSIVTTAQTVVGFSGLPTRYTGGAQLEMWVGCSSVTGATAQTITVNYTNQSGTAGQVTPATTMIASMPANRMFQVPLASGDTGVQAVASATFSASSGTAGNIWILVMKKIAVFSAPVVGVNNVSDFAALGLPQIDDTSCLLFVHQGTTTTSGVIMAQISVVQG